MTGPVSALRKAVRQRLVDDAALLALLGGPRVHDEPPRAAEPPYVTFGPASAAAWNAGAVAGRRHALSLVVWSRQGGDAEALAIAARLEELLDDATLTLEGHRLVLLSVSGLETARPDRAGLRRVTLRLAALTEPL
ncbi:DUF3168 domain-containing protein [Alsobacter sp. SYSU M60028]|uniref:DUF3168 domain-containing protein n=1 Tax=Alsobacter ponti TaxID=2962936 RepID=A0ABT1L8H4_9HYPH|nr:DUF3168 domain-containing protein [Alsobacter ponti]